MKKIQKVFLAYWCDLVTESKFYPLLKLANTVKGHWKGIVNYLFKPISNGILESTNSKIQEPEDIEITLIS